MTVQGPETSDRGRSGSCVLRLKAGCTDRGQARRRPYCKPVVSQAYSTDGRAGAYCAAKGGIFSLTHSRAVELAPYGVLVNAIAPGCIHTPSRSSTESMKPRPTSSKVGT